MSNNLVEDTIKEIAARHSVAIGKDDPILIMLTINELLMRESANAQQSMLTSYKEELELIARRWSDDAKLKAERILTAALIAARDGMDRAMAEGAKKATDNVRSDVETALAGVRGAVDEARQMVKLNLIAAGFTVLAATIALASILSR